MKFDPTGESKRDIYFRLIECIVPRPIAWVGTRSTDGIDNLAPFSFFTGVSASPPTLLFCAGNHRGGVPKDTVQNILDTSEFSVNVVSRVHAEAMVQTSGAYASSVNEFNMIGLTAEQSELIKAPRVGESNVSFECVLHDVVEMRDDLERVTTRIIIGRIQLIHIADHLLDEAGRVDPRRLNPVARIGGHDYAALGEVFTIKRPKA